MRRVDTQDVVVAAGFVLAAMAEAAVRDQGTPGRLALDTAGALFLTALVMRRRRPVATMLVITGAGLLGTTVDQLVWPGAPDGGGVWIFALMLTSYSLGAHARGWVITLGVLGPLCVVTVADVTMTGWSRVSGMLFVSLFVGGLPTVAGCLVRVRRDRLETLRGQRQRITEAQRARQESVVLAERLGAMERLQPSLLSGLKELAAIAEVSVAGAEVESLARALLTRTREEVVALTAPVEAGPVPALPPADHVAALRVTAQPWATLAAGAVAAGLCVETTHVIAPATPWWSAIGWGMAVGAPLAALWWRPVLAAAVAWIAAGTYAHLLAPLDGTLSAVGLTFVSAFAVAALSHRRTALGGLAVCWLGQLLGVGAADPLGEGTILLVCWCGGLAVKEVSRLVEQSRAYNELLTMQEEAETQRAVVEERMRLAREVHDVIGHSLTVAALQAGAARRLADTDPDRAREALDTVAAVARDGATALAGDQVSTDVTRLVEHVRAAGLEIEADLADLALLDPARRGVATRVVQEALTNVLRHAPCARVNVTVRRSGREVGIVVTNSGSAAQGPGPGTGRGLPGIRERVNAAAGRVTWHPRADGGFEVRASLPVVALADAP